MTAALPPAGPMPLPTDRAALIARLSEPVEYDLLVVGGGATGLGVAVDAAARGLSVVLVDSHDFAKGTSSRATKLLHGGVRYLAQGNISLVREALHERTTLLRNAPHLAQPLAFVMPSYRWWEQPFYGAGLILYDALAGKAGLGRAQFLGRAAVHQRLPNLRTAGLRGGVQYWDGQFDDARLALALARTAARAGALLINYCAVRGLLHDGEGKVTGAMVEDVESRRTHTVRARCVVNATGVWVDTLRQLDAAAAARPVAAMIAPSQGVHLVVDREFLQSDHALIVPRTEDGRVLFAVPWLGKVILGTTDTPRADVVLEPLPMREEVAFILRESARYLAHAPTVSDVRSAWVGLRPLVKPDHEPQDGATRRISREHTVQVGRSGLVTVTGGKWTTYRAMAEDVLAQCFDSGLLPRRPGGLSENLRLVGAPHGTQPPHSMSDAPGMSAYGAESDAVQSLPGADHVLGGGLTEAMVRFAVRYEYARTAEDILARRSRLLFLDARLAGQLAEPVAAILQSEGIARPEGHALQMLAQQYLQLPA